jgi:hypothetical protein
MYRCYFISCVITFIIVLGSCSKRKVDEIQIINIDMNSTVMLENNKSISKIELIPLQTIDSSLLGNIRQMIFTDTYIIVSDNRSVVSVFDAKGKFISNSKKRYGHSPEEYSILMGFTFNKYNNNIEILTPNYLLSYDVKFNYQGRTVLPVEKKVSDQKRGLLFEGIFAIDNKKYILLPTTVSSDPHSIIFFDANTNEVFKKSSYSDQVIAGLTQQVQNIDYYKDSVLSFSPNAFSYYYYTIDLKTLRLKKEFKLDFGKQSVEPEDLVSYKSEREKCDYLAFNSKYPLPLRTFFNSTKIVSIIRKENDYFTFIKSATASTEVLIKNKLNEGENQLPIFEALIENVLYAKISPNELEQYNLSKFLDEQGRLLLKSVKPEDNPLIIKYYLK